MIKFKRFILIFLIGVLASFSAGAQSISITQAQTLTFPTVGVASSGSTISLSVSPLNSSTSGTAVIVGGFASRGQYNLSVSGGGSPVSISVDISGVTTGNAGLTLGTFRGYYSSTSITSFPSQTLPLPATSPGSTPLFLGATMTANSMVTAGSYNPSFTITVLVQ